MLCSYGCGQEAKYQLKNGKWCCCHHYSGCPNVLYKKKHSVKKKSIFHVKDFQINENEYKCPICGVVYSKNGMINHYYRKHTEEGIKFVKNLIVNKFNSKGCVSWSKGLTKDTNENIKKRGINLHLRYKNGELTGSFKGKHHTDEVKQILSIKQRNSTHRRLVKSCRNYICKDGTVVLLDSSWEERLAELLDKKNYNWCRPKEPLPWYDDKGLLHYYFPDFYLPDYNVYFDPKNPYAERVQKKKLDILLKEYNNIIILRSVEEIDNFENLLNKPL